MPFSAKQIIGLPVFTLSGARLGKVRDFVLLAEEHLVEKYLVSVWPLSKKQLLVGRAQVKEIREDKMIVDDAVLKEMKALKTERGIKQGMLDSAVSMTYKD